MYVCVCNPITDREVRGCVRQGARTLSDLQIQLGIASQCGMCASAALAIVQEEISTGAGSCTAAESCPLAA